MPILFATGNGILLLRWKFFCHDSTCKHLYDKKKNTKTAAESTKIYINVNNDNVTYLVYVLLGENIRKYVNSAQNR